MKLFPSIRLNQAGSLHVVIPIAVIVVVAIGGAFFMVSSQAATPKKTKHKNVKLVVRIHGTERDVVCNSTLTADFTSPQAPYDPAYDGGLIGRTQTNSNAEKCKSKKVKGSNPVTYIYDAEYRLNAKVLSYCPSKGENNAADCHGQIYDNQYELDIQPTKQKIDFRYKEDSAANGYKLDRLDGFTRIYSPTFPRLQSKYLINLEAQ